MSQNVLSWKENSWMTFCLLCFFCSCKKNLKNKTCNCRNTGCWWSNSCCLSTEFHCNHVVLLSLSRGQWRSLSCRRLLHPPQLTRVRSWLVPTVPGAACSLLPSPWRTKGKHHRDQRRGTPQDSVRISHCQLWYVPGGWCWTIHPRGHWSTVLHPYSRPCPQPWWWCPLTVLSTRKLLILWPYDACVALGLDDRWGSEAGIWAANIFYQIIKWTKAQQNIKPSYDMGMTYCYQVPFPLQYLITKCNKTLYFHNYIDFYKLVFKQIMYSPYAVY